MKTGISISIFILIVIIIVLTSVVLSDRGYLGCVNNYQYMNITPQIYFYPDIISTNSAQFSGLKIFYTNQSQHFSMMPTIYGNSTILVKPISSSDIFTEGDMIVFNYSSQKYPVIHRIVKITNKDGNTLYFTKGDNNYCYDSEQITRNDIIGRVVGILY